MVLASLKFLRESIRLRNRSAHSLRQFIGEHYADIFGHAIPQDLRIGTARNLVYYHMQAVEHSQGLHPLSESDVARIQAYLLARGPVDPFQREVEELSDLTMETSEMAQAVKKATAIMEIKKSANGRPTVEGVSVSGICKWLGKAGYKRQHAEAVIGELFGADYLKNVMPSTISTGLNDGRHERETIPTLSGTLETRIKRVCGTVKIEAKAEKEKPAKKAKTAKAETPEIPTETAKPAKKKVVKKVLKKKS